MTQVCVISIHVPDMEKAIGFYTMVLGFEVNKEYGPKIVTLVHGELPIVVEESERASSEGASGVVLTLKTDDIYGTVTALKEHDVEFILEEPTACPPGKYISFRDPFGNVWEYLEFD